MMLSYIARLKFAGGSNVPFLEWLDWTVVQRALVIDADSANP